MHKAQSLHDEGNIDGAREEILRARAKFAAADRVAPQGAGGKISEAVARLDELNGGIKKAEGTMDKAEQFLPQIPRPFVEAIKMGITQSVQALNPAEWLTEPDRVFQKWMDIHGLTTPNDVQKYFEEQLHVEHPETRETHPQNQKKKRTP